LNPDAISNHVKHLCQEANSERFDIICLGLGSPENSAFAQLQLAFLVLLLQQFNYTNKHQSPVDSIRAYDPVFSSVDIAILRRFQISVDSVNEEGHCAARRPTLFFMPHCGNAMYHNLVRANWSIRDLQQLIIIGNSFSAYSDKLAFAAPSGQQQIQLLRQEFCFLCLSSAVDETPIDEADFELFCGAFNDTSIHRFSSSRLQLLPASIWSSIPEKYRISAGSEIIPSISSQ
jgi:hypothetical protein